MNDDFLETFFAGCDESTMAQLIGIFESGDEKQLNEIVESLSDEEMKKQLLDGFAKLKQFKAMETDDE